MSDPADTAKRWAWAIFCIVGGTLVFSYTAQGITDAWALGLGYASFAIYIIHYLLYGFGKGGVPEVLERLWHKLQGRK